MTTLTHFLEEEREMLFKAIRPQCPEPEATLLLQLHDLKILQKIREEVEKVRRDLKSRMEHEDYGHCETCDETLYHLQHVLSLLTPKEQEDI